MRTKHLAAAAALATSATGLTALAAPAAHAVDTLQTFGCTTNSYGTVCLAIYSQSGGGRYQQVAFTSNSTFQGGMNASWEGQIHQVYQGQLTANVTSYSNHDAIPNGTGQTVCGSAWKTATNGSHVDLDFVCLTTP